MNAPQNFYRTIEKKKIYQKVVEQITDLILQNQLQPGDKLPPERQLAEQLGVSRNAVREAVKALQERGLLDVVQGAGTFVRNLSSDTVSDSLSLYLQTNMPRYIQLMELREMLDVEIAGRLAQKIDAEYLDLLWQGIKRMERLLDSPGEFAKEDVAFHINFYRATKNDVILLVMQPVLELLVETMTVSFEKPESMISSLRGHRELVERIEAGDEKGARLIASQVIARGKGRLQKQAI